tara:strand:+ start:150 stop:500 length:351 start_codon:yes stop_codon:yes gene_type:complete
VKISNFENTSLTLLYFINRWSLIMSKTCQLTGKTYLSGNNVSHAKNRTKRRFMPNLQSIAFVSEKLGKTLRLKVATSAIRTVEKKGGIDNYLINTPNTKLPPEAKKLKKQILSITN